MKMKKRAWSEMCLLLAAALALTSCGKTQQPFDPQAPDPIQTSQAGYVEEELSPDHHEMLGMFYVNKTLHYFTVENQMDPLPQWNIHWYTLNEDDSWAEHTDHGFAQVAASVEADSSEAVQVRVYLDQSETLYWQIRSQSGGMNSGQPWSEETLSFVVRDGQAEPIPAPPEGETAVFFDESTNRSVVCGDTVVRYSTSARLDMFDRQGRLMPGEMPEPTGRLLCGNQNGYYLYNEERNLLEHYTLGTTTAEIVLDARHFRLTDPDCAVHWGAAGEDDTLYLTTRQGVDVTTSTTRLFRYRWSKTQGTPNSGTLTVFSVYPSQTVKDVANLMQKQMGIQVEYQSALDDEVYGPNELPPEQEAVTLNDVLTQLNAQLLAGKGPDVLILDGLPVESMIDKGVLMDLTGQISTEGMLTNLAKAYQTEEGMFVVPGRCHPLLVAGTRQMLEAVPHVQAAAKQLAAEDTISENAVDWKNGTLPLFAYQSDAQLFNHFYALAAADIWKDGTLQEPAYRQFIAVLGKLLSSSGSELLHFPMDRTQGGYYQLYNGSSGAFFNGLCSACCDFFMGPEQLAANFVPDETAPKNWQGVCEAKAFVDENGHSCVYPAFLAGVNASANNPEMAVSFIQMMLSEEIQTASHYEGFPVQKAALQSLWKKNLERYRVTSHTDLCTLVESMDVVPRNEFLRRAAAKGVMVWQETQSVDAAAEAAQDAIKLWLAEQ